MTVMLVPVRPFADAGPGFNHAEAEAAYGAIMKCATDDEAAMLSTVLMGRILQHDLLANREEIAKALTDYHRERVTTISKSLIRSAVSKARDGQDPSGALNALELIAKVNEPYWSQPGVGGASKDPVLSSYSVGLAERARQQKRDLLNGRFVEEHRHINHPPFERPLHPKQAKAILGVPPIDHVNLTDSQLAQYQRGYRDLFAMLEPYSMVQPGQGVVHLNYADGTTDFIDMPASTGGKLSYDAIPVIGESDEAKATEGLDPKKKLISAALSVPPAPAATGLDSPQIQAHLRSALADRGALNEETWRPDKKGSYGYEMTRTLPDEHFSPAMRVIRRLGATADTLRHTLGPGAPPKLQLALAVGGQAGKTIPQAQKVIGPFADRTSYRYRGVEREPDARLLNAVHADRASIGTPTGELPLHERIALRFKRRDKMIHGDEDEFGNFQPGAVTQYLRRRLPKTEHNALQTMSGTVPPSEGVIFDKHGDVVTQAVGYGEDHYLPFKLTNLRKLKGGEYMRTRTWGGPTTEDIYTGLISGAKGLTVVSHNGSYTLEFDDKLTGGRRFNDKAARMVARYGQLLDAVKSKQVTTGGLHPSRLAEIEAEAERSVGDRDRNEDRWMAEVERRKRIEARNPTLSEAQKGAATKEFFDDLAAERTTRDGHVMTSADLVEDYATKTAVHSAAQIKAVGGEPRSLSDLKLRAVEVLRDDDPVKAGQKLADALGERRRLDAYVRTAEEANKLSRTPLSLNGEGYDLALKALQEQFPYYIKSTKFHPWVNAHNGRDTGYVMPKHNRPADALAGYFDAAIGQRKVHAHTIRFQNYGVHGGKPTPYESRDERFKRTRDAATGGSGGGTAGGGSLDPKVAAALQQGAARDLISALKRATHFSSRALPPRAGGDPIAGKSVKDFLPGMRDNTDFRALHDILSTDQDKLEERLRENPTAMVATLRAALKENEGGQEGSVLLDIDSTLKRNFLNDGKIQPKKRLDDDPAAHLDDPEGTEYDIPSNIVFDEDRPHSTTEIKSVYTNDSHIKELAKSGDLPESIGSVTAAGTPIDVGAMLSKLGAKLKAERQALIIWDAKNAITAMGTDRPDEQALRRRSEGFIKARQLYRRHSEAEGREKAVLDAQLAAAAPQQFIHFLNADGTPAQIGFGNGATATAGGGAVAAHPALSPEDEAAVQAYAAQIAKLPGAPGP